MEKLEKVTECCNVKPEWYEFALPFGDIGKLQHCPKCRSCCSERKNINIKN